MPADIPSFREPCSELFHYAGRDAYHEVVLPWLPQAQEAMSVLAGYGLLAAHAWKKDEAALCVSGNRRLCRRLSGCTRAHG